jgi:hypothetical protein
MYIINLLNYVLYRYYRRVDPQPDAYSMVAAPVLFMLNAISMIIIIDGKWLVQNAKVLIISLIVFFGVINYLLVYWKDRHEETFRLIGMEYEKHLFFVRWIYVYIISSVLGAVATAIIVGYLNREW